uniref:Uncharacterized protein n=1 Tax=Nelumbo nucifera TaxID=4432 RepID=A0A822XMN4_NELNU|nr:TPA_asm: hypothetical protein HUJ06_021924 [Nelumbo nucifera]
MGTGDSGSRRCGLTLSCKNVTEIVCKWDFNSVYGSLSAQRAAKPVEDENPSPPAIEFQRLIDQEEDSE